MARVWLVVGAALTAAGIVALIEAHAHRPPETFDIQPTRRGWHALGVLNLYSQGSGWSRTAYDAAHTGGAVLLLAGALLMIASLVALARRPAPSDHAV
jgi:hypothetical protein